MTRGRRGFSALLAAGLTLGPAGAAAQVDRSLPPEPARVRPYRFPKVERASLPNGLEIQVIERPALPVATIALLVPAGADAEPADRAGLAQLAARLVIEGTKTRTGAQIAEAIEGLGGTITSSAGWDVAFVQASVLSRNLAPALEILGDVAQNPSFPEREVERLKNQRLAEIQQQRARPEGLAAEMFNRLVYDEATPYARPSGGTPETVSALTRDEFVAFHARAYRPNGAMLIVVGDAKASEVQRFAQQAFGAWPKGQAERVEPVIRPGGRTGRIYLFDRPGSVQSAIQIGGVAIPRNHPDYVPGQVLNTIFGGAFGSRINMNLREARGYSYGFFSGFFTPKGLGTVFASGSVRTATTDSSVAELLKEIRRIREEAVPLDELEAAKQNVIGRFPADFLTNQQLATALTNRVVYALPADYYDTYRERIARVDAATVQALARKYIDPQRFVWVIVGDASQVEGPLRALNAFPVEAMPAETKGANGGGSE